MFLLVPCLLLNIRIMESKKIFAVFATGFFLILALMVDSSIQMPTQHEKSNVVQTVDSSIQMPTQHEKSNVVQTVDTLISNSTKCGKLGCATTEKIVISSVSGIFVVFVIGIFIYTKDHCGCRKRKNRRTKGIRNSKKESENEENRQLIPTAGSSEEDSPLDNGAISMVELYNLVQYAKECDEYNELRTVISILNSCKKASDENQSCLSEEVGTRRSYGSTGRVDKCAQTGDCFRLLCSWKEASSSSQQQIYKLYEACSTAHMDKTLKKIQDFRASKDWVSDLDLEHILWQIGKKSPENITTFFSRLPDPVNFSLDPGLSLAKTIPGALLKLNGWAQKSYSINPIVILSLKMENLCEEDVYFFELSDEEKGALDEQIIRKHALNASKSHCNRLMNSKELQHKGEKMDVNTIFDENEGDLFCTVDMIRYWVKQQKCSKVEKICKLEEAVNKAKAEARDAYKSLTDEQIKELASKRIVQAAWDLLMMDIKPFAKALWGEELDSYPMDTRRQQATEDKHTGTAGLLAKIPPKKKFKVLKEILRGSDDNSKGR